MRRPVNEKQYEVLQWVGENCREARWTNDSYKLSAIALQNRGLLRVSKQGGWRAELTDTGRYYLEHRSYPGEIAAKRSPAKVPKRERPPDVTPPRFAELKTEESATTRTATPAPPEIPDVPVPAALRSPHPAVAALRDDNLRFDLTGPARGRALRIAQGLTRAMEREGWKVRVAAPRRTEWGTSYSRDHLFVNTGEREFEIRFIQEKDRAEHVPTARELADKQRWSWTKIPEYDYTPSDRLKIDLTTYSRHGRQHRWSDGKRGPVEAKLGRIILELRTRQQEEVEERQLKEREAEERRLAWELEVERAKVQLREAHRAEVLLRQADDWTRARQLEQYLDALEALQADTTANDDLGAWIAWGRSFVERLDSLRTDIGMPEDPEPTDEALRPYLPKRGYW